MVTQLDAQLSAYDSEVGERMHLIDLGKDGRLRVADVEKALQRIAHAPSDEAISVLCKKLDVDHDGFVRQYSSCVSLSLGWS